MKLIKATALSLLFCAPIVSAGNCVGPEAPTMPDGASSTMDQMIAGQKAVKAFQATNIEYMACLETSFNGAEAQIAESAGDEKAAAQSLYNESLDAYNAAVSIEEEVASSFNSAIRDYKAANPK